jgi:hypothetical protein
LRLGERTCSKAVHNGDCVRVCYGYVAGANANVGPAALMHIMKN